MVLHGLARSVPFSCQDLARLCAKSCQNVMASHGKSWQDLANIFLREQGGTVVTLMKSKYIRGILSM